MDGTLKYDANPTEEERKMYSRIWKAIAEEEDEKQGVLYSFRTFQKLRTVRDIIRFIKRSGSNATFEAASIDPSEDRSTCVTNYILEVCIAEIASQDSLAELLRREGVDEHPVINMQAFRDNANRIMCVNEMGCEISTENYVEAACFFRLVQIFTDSDTFTCYMQQDRALRDLAQRIDDSAICREEAAWVFRAHGLDLRWLANHNFAKEMKA